jgi:4-hydroxyphenylacetate 3-monooxygenase
MEFEKLKEESKLRTLPATAKKLQEVLKSGTEPYLMTGQQYKESLRDGRTIIDAKGNIIEDPVTHPQLKNGIDTLAKMYDAQFDPELQELTTFVDKETGNRYSTDWMIPRTFEDLEKRRKVLRMSTYKTFGVFGRPNDYGSMMAMGFLSVIDKIEEEDKELAENVRSFVEFSQQHNIICADLIADVQTDRKVPIHQREGRLRIVERRSDGVVLYGAKPCASVSAIGHFMTVSTALSPGLNEDAAIWGAIPVNSKGLSIVLREPVTNHESVFDDHPIDAFGEEIDSMMIFDNVFIPNEYLFSVGNLKLLGLYRESCAIAHWHILSRLMYRAEIFAGVAQTIADILDTKAFQGVRDSITEVISYAATLKAFIIAAEKEAEDWNGIKVPSDELITVGRLHSIENYPRVMHILRDMSGQGLISRFTKKTWEHPNVGPKLDEMLKGTNASAFEKNRFFNFVWDLTCSSHASRVALFENVNSTNAPIVKAEIFRSYDRSEPVTFIRDYLKLPPLE